MNFNFPDLQSLIEKQKDFFDQDSLIKLKKQENKKILKITSNSAEIQNNQIIFCLFDLKNSKYLEEALKKDAICFAGYSDDLIDLESKCENLFFIKKNFGIRLFYALISSDFFDLQEKFCDKLKISAITGTNGKTSSAFFFKQITNLFSFPAASIGTLGLCFDEKNHFEKREDGITTPDSFKFHEMIFDLAENKGVFHIAFEASSHGINQHRLSGFPPFQAVCFTNFSQDHLDYHGSLEEYWAVKKSLFDSIATSGKTFACINLDDSKSDELIEIAKKRNLKIITYSVNSSKDAMISLKSFDVLENFELRIELDLLGKNFVFKLNAPVFFQISNLMAALSCVLANLYESNLENTLKIFEEKYIEGNCSERLIFSPPGRSEILKFKNSLIIIDYAHTPDALQTILNDLRRVCNNNFKILTIFGCGGERDRGKRPLMAEIASKFSDFVILTTDNPRNEPKEQIFQDIIHGFNKAQNFIRIDDRREAIKEGLSRSKEFQIILIAGKGHESFQFFENDRKEKFNDLEVVKEIIADLG